MEYKHTIENIEKATGLDYHFILKCIREIPTFFDIHTSRGGKSNQLLVNDSAFTAFDKISQLKREGRGLKSIKDYFREHFTESSKSQQLEQKKSVKEDYANNSFDEWRKDFKDFYQDMIKAKDEVIQSKEHEVHILKTSLQLLLPDGKTPQQVREEQQNKENELHHLKLKAEQTIKEKEEAELIIAKKNKELEEVKQKEEKLQELLQKLGNLEGKWFSGSQRSKILHEIQMIV